MIFQESKMLNSTKPTQQRSQSLVPDLCHAILFSVLNKRLIKGTGTFLLE